MADGGELDAALVQYLRGDATLASLLPDGVSIDEAPQGHTRFVFVLALPQADDEGRVYGAGGFELVQYRIVAVGLNRAIDEPTLRQAAARLDVILDGAQITAPGYAGPATVTRRGVRVRTIAANAEDASITWQERGGVYEVHAPI